MTRVFITWNTHPRVTFSGFNGMVAQTLANRVKKEPAGTELYFSGSPVMGYDSISEPSVPCAADELCERELPVARGGNPGAKGKAGTFCIFAQS